IAGSDGGAPRPADGYSEHPNRRNPLSIKTFMALAGALAAALALQGQASGAPTCTINWTGPAGGNWSTAGNWTVVSNGSHRVPLGNDNACVTSAGAAVVVDSNQTVGSLIVGTAGTTPDQKVTVTGS